PPVATYTLSLHDALPISHKRYRPKKVRRKGELEELGFEGATSFANDAVYRQGQRFARSRDQRAAARKTEYGRSLLVERWPSNERSEEHTLNSSHVSISYA